MLALFANADPEPLDLGGSTVTVTLAVDALDALAARSTSYSYTVSLPRHSVRNRRFFGAIDDPGTDAYAPNVTGTALGGSPAARPTGLRVGLRVPCRLTVDGHQILEGLMRIAKVTDDAVDVQLTGEASPWASTMESTELRQLTAWAPTANPTYDVDLMVDTWEEVQNGTMGGLVDPASQANRWYFPWVDYGRLTQNFAGTTYQIDTGAFFPAVQVRGLIHAAFAQAGYRLVDRDLIPRELVMLFTGADGWREGLPGQPVPATGPRVRVSASSIFATNPALPVYGTYTLFDTVDVDVYGDETEVSTLPTTPSLYPNPYNGGAPLGNWTGATLFSSARPLIHSPGVYHFRYDVTFRISGLNHVESQLTGAAFNADNYNQATLVKRAFLDINTNGVSVPGFDVFGNPGSGYTEWRFQGSASVQITAADIANSSGQPLEVAVCANPEAQGFEPMAIITGSYLEMTATDVQVRYGGDFSPLSVLPEGVTVLDFVKDLLKIGNLYAETVGNEVFLYTRDEYFRGETAAGYLPTGTNAVPGAPFQLLQLGEYVDGETEETTWPGQDEPASRTFAWAEDDDVRLEDYETVAAKPFASETRTNPNAVDASRTEAVELDVFSATLGRYLVALDGSQYTGLENVHVLVLRETLDAEDQGEYTTDWNPRLAFARIQQAATPQEWELTDLNGNVIPTDPLNPANKEARIPLADFERLQGSTAAARSLRFDDTDDPALTQGNPANTGIVTNRYARQLALRNAARLVELVAYLPPGVLARGPELFRLPVMWRGQLWYLQEVNQWDAQTHACQIKIIKRDG